MSFPTSGLIGANFDVTSTDAQFQLGTVVVADNGGRWMYVKASVAVAAYDVVSISSAFAAQGLTKTLADSGAQIGIAQIAFAANDYGWVALSGMGLLAKVANGTYGGVPLYAAASTTGGLSLSGNALTEIVGIAALVTASAVTTTAIGVHVTVPHVNLT